MACIVAIRARIVGRLYTIGGNFAGGPPSLFELRRDSLLRFAQPKPQGEGW
jgi:hypothetical protein